MSYCSNCGFELSPGSKFCGNCGRPVAQEQGSNSYDIGTCITPISYREKVEYQYGGSCHDNSLLDRLNIIKVLNDSIIELDRLIEEGSIKSDLEALKANIKNIRDQLVNEDYTFLSDNSSDIFNQATSLLTEVVAYLKTRAKNDEYRSAIETFTTAFSELISLEFNYSISKRKLEEESEPKDVQDTKYEKLQKEIDEEIESLENELREHNPKLNIHEYDPDHDYWKELEELTGLNNVKTQLKEHISSFRVHQVRKQMHPELKSEFKFNCIFKGRPGTGKTTVARILSGILRQENIIHKGQCVEVDSSKITTGWIGFTSKMTRLAALKAVGGVLFIDEAYSLVTSKGGNNNLGNEAMDALTPIMTNYSDNLIVVLAGYENEMNNFMNQVNTGLASRFQKNVDFDDYSASEMFEIFMGIANKNCYKLDSRATRRLSKLLDAIAMRKDRNRAFANARTVRSVFDAVRNKAAQRYINDNSIDPDLITFDDVTLSAQELKTIGAI